MGRKAGYTFMLTKGRIARRDITNAGVTTIQGAKIGDNEKRILSLYLEQIKMSKHHYVGSPSRNGKYITFVPKDATDKNYRIIFVTYINKVGNFRSGKLPEVEYIESCS
ncbi:hypothetical protein QUB70_07155 [Microcoleus sp. A003_D6]|uniref:hypothetical protein n=1 Tax=Microcoleus sp. A003_D6 TaxID=3055266 RepID=UPI002FD44046